MIRLLSLGLLLTLLNACQVDGDVRTAKQLTDSDFLQFRVHPPLKDWLEYGSPLDLTLRFPYDVTVTGYPYIEIDIGGFIKRAYYFSGSGSKALIFRYKIGHSDHDTDGITISRTLHYGNGGLEYKNEKGQTLSVSTEIQVPNIVIKVDGGRPIITSITTSPVGRYSTGQNFDYTFFFSEKVYVMGAATFNINLDSGPVPVTYLTGSGTNRLIFRRKILISDLDEDGFSTDSSFSLNESSNISIKDQSGNNINPTFSVLSTPSVINSPGPSIISVTPPPASTYVSSDFLDFIIDYSDSVEVTGSPSLTVKLATGNAEAKYTGGSGTSRITFQLTIKDGDYDMDGISLEPQIALNGGTIKQLNSVMNASTVFGLPDTSAVNVDAFAGPSVFYITLPQSKTYSAGEVIEFTLGFNSSIIVSGTPQLQIYLGPFPRSVYADYIQALSDSHNLVFQYTVTPQDDDPDGITLSSPILLNGGTITGAEFGTEANLFYSVPDASGAKVIP